MDGKKLTRQGPLASGAMVDMGTFESILGYVVGQAQPEAEIKDAERCSITVLAIYGSEDLLIGAERQFELTHGNGTTELSSETVETRQLTSRAERRRFSKGLAKDV